MCLVNKILQIEVSVDKSLCLGWYLLIQVAWFLSNLISIQIPDLQNLKIKYCKHFYHIRVYCPMLRKITITGIIITLR